MKNTGGRYIPIGYSAADISSIRPMFQNYLVCGPEDDTIDFFAINIYEWVPPLHHLVDVVRRHNLSNFRLCRPYERITRLPNPSILLRRRL